MSDKLKPIPRLASDEDAERFVAEADLTRHDLTGFRPGPFEFERKAAQINMRVPEALLQAVKSRAEARGIPFTRYIRMLMEQDIARG
jgi:predicted DNA binding CopG/RHH family protein